MYSENDIYGIGKICVNIQGLKQNNIVIPSLHFLVFKSENGYESFCLELQLSSFSSDDNMSVSQLSSQVSFFLKKIFSESAENAGKQIMDLVSDDISDYWRMYRRTAFKLGLSGFETDSNRILFGEIESLKKRIAFLETIKDNILYNAKNDKKCTENIETKNEYEYNKLYA